MSRLFYGRRIWTPPGSAHVPQPHVSSSRGGDVAYMFGLRLHLHPHFVCAVANIDFNQHKPSVRFMGHRQIVKIQIRHRMIGNGLGILMRVVKSIQSKWVNWLQQYQAASKESLIYGLLMRTLIRTFAVRFLKSMITQLNSTQNLFILSKSLRQYEELYNTKR